ncbi:Vacuolar protein sorting-associated protein 35 [Galdieria sulphuraria]|nr:Vacuolar protein sorting-associated protein 35 [Galdieria sulphuraria]
MERALRKPEDEHTKRRNATCLKIKEETHLRRSGSSSNVHHRNDALKRRSASLSALSKIANSSERASPRNTNAKYNSDGNNINVNKESNSAMEHAEQQKLMRETAQELRKKNSVLLRQAIEKEDLVEVLARATEVLQALRIPTIHPRLYYELYLAVNNELRHLEWFFFDQVKRNQITALKLYEQVQETPHVLSRLYLLIVAGTVYMGVERKLTKNILKDLMEMCSGVQNPMKGLFLRGYLTQLLRSKLSENREDNENEQLGITTQEAIEFLLWNFGEANRLWIRMQYDANKERLKRDQERRQVETLVGLNISTLAHLSGLNVSLYSNVIFPTISQQICSCHDPIAQEYLADCVVQAFPDEYHLQTLSEF